MGFLKKLFADKSTKTEQERGSGSTNTNHDLLSENHDWETISSFINIEESEYELPAVISTAIAAGGRPNSGFMIKRILKRNPEALFVSLISASLSACNYPESSFVIKSIKKSLKKQNETGGNPMLRKFKISIDGKEYLVEMEEIGAVSQPVAPIANAVPAPVQTAPMQSTATEPAKAEPANVPSSPAGKDAMKAPMPGCIQKILVNVGDEVKENQPLLILEAMKMENEIVAAKSGKVTGIHVTLGQNVNAGEPLVTID